MGKVEIEQNEPMSEWLKKDAVRLDLPDEEIIHALCFECERYRVAINEMQHKVNHVLSGLESLKEDMSYPVVSPQLDLLGIKTLKEVDDIATEALKEGKDGYSR